MVERQAEVRTVIAAIERLPADAKVLVLTTFSGDGQVYAALRAGASGYLLKNAPPQQLVTAPSQAATHSSTHASPAG